MKIVTIIGARPQFIKSAAVSPIIRQKHHEIIVHTGQHYDKNMSDIFFNELKIPQPDYNLNIICDTHAQQTGNMMIKIESILLQEKPDYVITYGDTNSTLAGALTAAKCNIKTMHIEAGLRSFNRNMPEEINRVVTDHISEILFVPTEIAVDNLKKEGISKGIYKTGDVMCDILKKSMVIADKKSTIINDLNLTKKDYILITLHRQFLTVNKSVILGVLNAFKESNNQFIFPIHPRTKKYLQNYDLWDMINESENIKVVEPLGYLDFIYLMKYSKKIVTDSGGIQKEAYILDIPCITVREQTEWVETVEVGCNILVGYSKEKLLDSLENFNIDKSNKPNLYGQGNSGKKISDIIDSL